MKRGVVAAMIAAAPLFTGCGAEDARQGPSEELRTDLEQIQRQSDGPVYWLGSSFEGLPLTHSEGPQPAAPPPSTRPSRVPPPPRAPARGAFFVYGECNGEGSGESFHCTGPQLQLQHWPIASPGRYPEYFSCTRTTIRGVPAAQFDGFEIYIGRSLVRIYARDQAQARRAAAALRPLDGSATSRDPLPPPAIDVDEALKRCALDSLDAKLDELKADGRIPFLWVGRRFEQLPLFRVEGDARLARFMYGGCKTPEVAGSCYPALTIEVMPVAERRPAGWRFVRTGAMRCDRFHVGRAEAAFLPDADELTVFTGSVAVVLRGPDSSLIRRAADALYPFGGPSRSEELAPPSDELSGELRSVCG